MKVDFFIIGAPKCGTSSIAHYLSEHPQICFSKPKEPRYFVNSDYALECGSGSMDDYWNTYFSHYNSDARQISGEGTPMYLYYEESVPLILQHNPEAKFIVLVRNPVELVISLHKNLLRGYNESVFDLEKAWGLQESRLLGQNMPPHPQIKFDLQYKDICLLGKQVERLFSKVEREQVIIFLLEDLIKSPDSVYTALCSFLGVEHDGRKEFQTINEGKEWKSNLIRYFYSGAYGMKSRMFGTKPLPFNLDKRARRLLMKNKSDNSQISEGFIQMLHAEFEDDILLLSDLLERDLSAWTS